MILIWSVLIIIIIIIIIMSVSGELWESLMDYETTGPLA